MNNDPLATSRAAMRTPLAIRLSGIAADATAWADQVSDVAEARTFLRNVAERIALIDDRVAALEMLRERRGQVVAIGGGVA